MQGESIKYTRKRWFVLGAMSLSVFVLAFNTTALINALPVLRREFEISAASLQWIINAYILAAATFILIAGKLGDIFNRKTFFIFGVILFMIASVLLAECNNTVVLIITRLLQGIAAAFIASGSLAILKNTFHGRELGLAIGIWAAGIGSGNAFGPFLGGMLTEYLSWRYIFWSDALIMIAVILIAVKSISNNFLKKEIKDKFDVWGFVLFTSGIFLIVYGLSESQILGWNNPVTFILLISGLILICIFVKVECSVEHPLIHLGFFRKKIFVLANIGIFAVLFAEIAIPYFLNFYFQNSTLFNLSAVEAGLAVLPFSISLFVFTFLSVYVTRVFGYKYSVVGSLFLLVIGLFIFCYMGMKLSYCGLIAAMILCGGGIGICDPVFNVLGMNSLPEKYSGEASGVLNTVVYLGELSAIAFGSVCFFNFGRYTLSPVMKAADLSFTRNLFDKVLLGYNEAVQFLISGMPPGVRNTSLEIIQYSCKISFAGVMLLTALITLAVALISASWLSHRDYNVEECD